MLRDAPKLPMRNREEEESYKRLTGQDFYITQTHAERENRVIVEREREREREREKRGKWHSRPTDGRAGCEVSLGITLRPLLKQEETKIETERNRDKRETETEKTENVFCVCVLFPL